ncbi:MAG: 16S rRNA (uracil(1498)-N(3))-methyltransferase [Bacteroidales bacterium]|nr:16S rRNA (uracil(1498)-N(3))-methyltransferase [Bacteroidales bacterium]
MQLFYANQMIDGSAYLDETESGHCIRVLRKKKGDEIRFTDGKGKYYSGIITQDNPRQCILKVPGKGEELVKHNYNLHIAIAPTKNIDRFEWFVEKAVEIGVDSITPLLCRYSERKKLRSDRLEKIIISAMKQSIKAHLPVLHPLTAFKDFAGAEYSDSEKLIAHLEETKRTELIRMKPRNSNYIVLIGPEGDFHTDEINLAFKNDFQAVSLGHSRLRTETAGVAVCQIISDLESLKNN